MRTTKVPRADPVCVQVSCTNHVDQNAACFKSDLCVRSASSVATLLTLGKVTHI